MPENDLGLLTPSESVDVIAYILRAQGFTPGPEELLAVDSVFRAIQIDSAGAAL